jgi:hypothetical protein
MKKAIPFSCTKTYTTGSTELCDCIYVSNTSDRDQQAAVGTLLPCAEKKGLFQSHAFRVASHKIFVRLAVLVFLLAGLANRSFAQVAITQVVAMPPTNPVIKQYILANRVNVQLLYAQSFPDTMPVRVFGILKRTSFPTFEIQLNDQDVSSQKISLRRNVSYTLSPSDVLEAFGGFDEKRLTTNNIRLDTLMDSFGNIRLPDGDYQLCFYIKYYWSSCEFQGCVGSPTVCSNQFTISSCSQPINGATITPIITGAVRPVISQTISSNGIRAAVQFSNPPGCNTPVRVFGRIERLSPSPFTIALDPNFNQQPLAFLLPGVTQLSPGQLLAAFGNFNESNLIFNGIDPASIREGNNLRLPDGNYRICFYVRYITSNGTLGGNASDPNLGCASFTLCYSGGSAPQFTQPVNNLNINSSYPVVRPTSPVVFTWTPPQSICGVPPGGYRYDFEIREILDNQTVTDAINNPFVFQKIALPSTTFVLDTMLYRNVLQQGKRYAIRVKANNANLRDTFTVENNGYSRVEAFQYGNSSAMMTTTFPMQPPQFYYVPFGERRTDYWDDVYTAYQNGRRRDTAVPLNEYIALNLVQNGVAYSADAIELFMALNPQLAGLKEVRLSNKARLPEFPVVQAGELRKFEEQHAGNLRPDPKETDRFRRLSDSLRTTSLRASDVTGNLVNELTSYNVQTVNRVTTRLLNDLLTELLYNLRQRTQKKNSDNEHLRNIVSGIRALMANSTNSTSYQLPQLRQRLSMPKTLSSALQFSLAGYTLLDGKRGAGFLPVEGPLLPLEVVVWRGATEPPARPISSAPELKAAYRVFYTTPVLYNHKNPRINAVSLPGLASTAPVSLPKLAQFKFWTLNMVNHKTTSAVDVETSDVFLLNNKKKWPNSKKIYVVLKVD